jgi:hypothetical protein
MIATEIKFADSDVVNIDDYIPTGEFNPHNVRPWLLHDHGFVVAVVFADCLQDAIDTAVDEWTDDTQTVGYMDRYLINMEDDSKTADWRAYGDTKEDIWNCESISFLGNASEPFDIETLGAIELHNPKLSFLALYNSEVK